MTAEKEYKEEHIAKAIGQALKTLRKEKGMSQSDVYFKCGLDRGVYQRYDAGHVSRPSTLNLIKISEALGISPGEIINRAYSILKGEGK